MMAKNIITFRPPSLSIRAPPWIERNNGKKCRDPRTIPISSGEDSIVATHRGTTTEAR
jgi:hypothetical protein